MPAALVLNTDGPCHKSFVVPHTTSRLPCCSSAGLLLWILLCGYLLQGAAGVAAASSGRGYNPELQEGVHDWKVAHGYAT